MRSARPPMTAGFPQRSNFAQRPLYSRPSPQHQQSQPVSKTDILLFQQLANPERTIVPENTDKLFSSLQQSGVPANLGTGGNLQSAPPRSQQSSARPRTSFDQLTQQKYQSRSGGGRGRSPQDDVGSSSSYYSGSSSGSESDVAMTPDYGRQGGPADYGRSGRGQPDYGRQQMYGPGSDMETPMSQGFESDSGSEGEDSPSPPEWGHHGGGPPMPMMQAPEPIFDPEIDRSNRQLYIQELMQYQRDGHQIGIEINDSTPTHVLKSECDLINESINTAEGVTRMKFALAFLMRLVELANTKLANNFLPLTGWTEKTMNTNSAQFDVPLRRLHNLYFRNSFGHPLMQLGMALVFSAGGYMMMSDSSFMGRMMGSAAPPMPAPQQAPQPQTFFNQQQPQQQTMYSAPPATAPMGGAGTFAPKFNNMSTMNEVAAAPVSGGPARPRRTVRPPNLGGRPIDGSFPVS